MSSSTDRPPSKTSSDWADTYARHSAQLMRMAIALVGRDEAHDLVAETMQRVINRTEWTKVTNGGAYLARSLIGAASDLHRATNRRRAREARATHLGRQEQFEESSPVDVRRAMQAITPQQRAIAYLVYWEDMTIPDVALWLDVSEGTVRRQLARAKDRLREVLR